MSETYPTWQKISGSRFESAEQRDGVPDFIIDRDRDGWWIKWRTSANHGGPFATSRAAKDSVAQSLERRANQRPVSWSAPGATAGGATERLTDILKDKPMTTVPRPHRIEVRESNAGWDARCSCGWRGRTMQTYRLAEWDGDEHAGIMARSNQ